MCYYPPLFPTFGLGYFLVSRPSIRRLFLHEMGGVIYISNLFGFGFILFVTFRCSIMTA